MLHPNCILHAIPTESGGRRRRENEITWHGRSG